MPKELQVEAFRFQRGTAAEWTAKNPVLQPGEPGYETDTNKLKIGNGVTAWNALAYLTGGSGGGGAVDSVFGRDGDVVAQTGDYNKTQVGLPNVDNTSDLDKPISNATQDALDDKSDVGHLHDASAVVSGTLDIDRIPTGTTGTTVPFGNDARFSDQRVPTDGSVTTTKIADANVTLLKLAAIGATTLLGNDGATPGTPEELTAAQAKSLLAITQADVSGLTAALALLAPKDNPTFTGVISGSGITLTGRFRVSPDTITDAATVALDLNTGNSFLLTLTTAIGSTRQLVTPTNTSTGNGQNIDIIVRQPASGGPLNLTFNSSWRLLVPVILSTGANKSDIIHARWNDADSVMEVWAFSRGDGPIYPDNSVSGYPLSGYGFISSSMPIESAHADSNHGPNWTTRLWVPALKPINAIGVFVTIPGVVGSGNNGFGVYTDAGVFVAGTPSDNNLWTADHDWAIKALSSPIAAQPAGRFVRIVSVASGTDPWVLYWGQGSAEKLMQGGYGVTNHRRAIANLTSFSSSYPSTIDTTTGSTFDYLPLIVLA